MMFILHFLIIKLFLFGRLNCENHRRTVFVKKNSTITLKLIDNFEKNNENFSEYGWDLGDANNSQNLVSFFTNNSTCVTNFTNIFCSMTTDSSESIRYNLEIQTLEQIKNLKFYTLNQTGNKEYKYSLNIIQIGSKPHCIQNNLNLKETKKINDNSVVQILNVNKGEHKTFYCSVTINHRVPNDLIFFRSTIPSTRNLSELTNKSLILNDRIYVEVNYSYPLNKDNISSNEIAFTHHNKELACKMNKKYTQSHFDQNLNSKLELLIDVEPKIDPTNFVCKFLLNIDFEPFNRENRTHFEHYIDLLDKKRIHQIECPIRANNFMPAKYYIIWSLCDRTCQKWHVKLVREFFPMSEFYVIENPSYAKHNNISLKCELFKIDPHHYHPNKLENQSHVIDFKDLTKVVLVKKAVIKVRVLNDKFDMIENSAQMMCKNDKYKIMVLFLLSLVILLVMSFLVLLYLAYRRDRKARESAKNDEYKFKYIKSTDTCVNENVINVIKKKFKLFFFELCLKKNILF
jgi:hypothetical protein